MSILRSIKIDAPKEFINPRLQLVSGKTVTETYRNTHPSTVHSCMKGKRTVVYDRIVGLKMLRVVSMTPSGRRWVPGTGRYNYYTGGKYIDLTIAESIQLRALVWTVINVKGEKVIYIDRVYSNQPWAYKAFKEHWKEFGDIRYNEYNKTNYLMTAKLRAPFRTSSRNVYLDTFTVFNNTKKLISNREQDGWYKDSLFCSNY